MARDLASGSGGHVPNPLEIGLSQGQIVPAEVLPDRGDKGLPGVVHTQAHPVRHHAVNRADEVIKVRARGRGVVVLLQSQISLR